MDITQGRVLAYTLAKKMNKKTLAGTSRCFFKTLLRNTVNIYQQA